MIQAWGIPIADDGYPSPTLVHPTFPWGDYQSLFRDTDSVRIISTLLTALESDRSDLAVRASAVSLYWHLSRLYPAYREENYDACGEPTGTYYLDYDVSDEWLAKQNQYRGNLAQIVRLVQLDECTDWSRTKWEITNACAARTGTWLVVSWTMPKKVGSFRKRLKSRFAQTWSIAFFLGTILIRN